ncbi:Putative uncharacterized protein YEL034C-A [Geodia barretti]|uniref:Uncharacterized protein n=1 Tax=Geodia barretti TaxID=519541 RepID=A0AA35SMA7_GEOBA|nr:Putative uncharacterized protein YEL034C-A [Geodia barretti]
MPGPKKLLFRMPLFGHCLCGNGYLFGAGFEDCDHKRLVGIKSVLNLLSQVTLWETYIGPLVSAIIHEGQETFFDIHQLIIDAFYVRYVHIVSRWADILVLFPREYIQCNQGDLGVPVFPRLGGRHFHDLAWASLNHDETVFTQTGALGGVCF